MGSRSSGEEARQLATKYGWAIALMLLLAIAAAVRLYRLDSVPGNLTADETDFFREVYLILEGHTPSWFHQGQPATLLPLGAYAMATSVRIFGDSISGLRMYAVVLSLATLVPFYLLVRQQCSLFVAVVATLLLSTNVWYLHFSRTAWANMNAAFVTMGVTASLLIGLEKGRWWWFVAAGVFTGLAPWAYVSARIVPLIVAFFFPAALVIYRKERRRVLWGFGIAAAVALVIAAPVLNELRQGYWDDYTARSRDVSIFHDRSAGDAWGLVPDNLWRTFRGFILLSNDDDLFRGSIEASRYAPLGDNLVDPATRLLFFVGLVASVWRWRKTALWWGMLLAPLVFQVFSVQTPNAARGLVVVPMIFLFVALGFDVALSGGRRLLGDRRRIMYGAAAVLVATGTVCAINVRSYFNWMESEYALCDRQPAIWPEEFDAWSAEQHHAAELDTLGPNTGDWRIEHPLGTCGSS